MEGAATRGAQAACGSSLSAVKLSPFFPPATMQSHSDLNCCPESRISSAAYPALTLLTHVTTNGARWLKAGQHGRAGGENG